jgi:hypothetical protein
MVLLCLISNFKLMGPFVLSLMVLLVLWQLPVLFRGQILLLFMVGGGLQLEVLLLLPVVVEVLHRFFAFASDGFQNGCCCIKTDIGVLLVGRLVA